MKTARTALTAIVAAAVLSICSGTVFAGDHDRDGRHADHHQQHHYHKGQAYHAQPHYGHRAHYGHGYGRAYGYGYYPRGYASTHTAGVLRGIASVIRAQGRFGVDASIAANNFEEARRRSLENEVKRTETFFTKRAINKAARTTESVAEAAAKTARIANAARPDRLGPTQYRPDLGLINWPAMLRRPEFSDLRASVDRMLAVGPAALHRHGAAVETQAKAMREAMRPLVTKVSPPEYAAARQFLLSLRYESQLALRGASSPAAAVIAAR